MIKQINSLDEYLIKQSIINASNEQTLSCLFRAILEPVLEIGNDEFESDVVFKVTNRDMFTGLLTRLEFSDINFIDYGLDKQGQSNLEETDFLLVMTSDFVSFLGWKIKDNGIVYYNCTNNKNIDKIIELLEENGNIDLSVFRKKYNTKNLSDKLTNICINKLAAMIDSSNGNVNTDVINENSTEDLSEKIDRLSKKARYISHEVKNQLSICDLYSGIIDRYCSNNDINDKTINHSLSCINKSIKISGNTLNQLKTLNSKELKLYKTNELINTAVDLSKAYLENRNITLEVNNEVDEEIFVDETLFTSVIINLVKNACEAFNEFDKDKKNWIKISTSVKNDSVEIRVSNNANPIINPEKIFEEGITTKSNGSGLGLFICKQNIEEQCGQLNLIKTDEDSTIFEIKFCL